MNKLSYNFLKRGAFLIGSWLLILGADGKGAALALDGPSQLFPAIGARGKSAFCRRRGPRTRAGRWIRGRFVGYEKLIKSASKTKRGGTAAARLGVLRKARADDQRLCGRGPSRRLGIKAGSEECRSADLTGDAFVDFDDLAIAARRLARRRSGGALAALFEIEACFGKVIGGGSSSSSSFSLDLGSLTIPRERIPDWSRAGVEGGIPDTSNWPVVNALEFGAVPNDDSDDSAAINAAIGAAASASAPSVVVLPEGTYTLVQPNKISLKSNVVLRGAGSGKTLIRARQGSAPSDGIQIRGAEHYDPFTATRIENAGGRTRLRVAGTDFENYYPGYKLEAGSRIALQGSTGLDCNGDGQGETSYGACANMQTQSVSGDSIILNGNVILDKAGTPAPDRTCAELGGSVCADNRYCYDTLSATSDTARCCNNKRCAGLTFHVYPRQIPISGLERGSSRINLSQPPYFKQGEYVALEQDNDQRISPNTWFAGGLGQIVKVTGVSPAGIEVYPPLRDRISLDAKPRITRPDFIFNAGVEDLSIEFANVTPVPLYRGSVIAMSFAQNCWVRGVEARNAYQNFVDAGLSAHVTIADSRFQTVQKPDYTNTYAISFSAKTSDSLVTNNILEDVWVTMIFSGSANGNVYSYNYEKDIREDHGIFHHGSYPFENLIEGNDAYRITHDRWWGRQGPRITYFRNRASEIRTSLNGYEDDIVANELNVIANSARYFLSYPWCTYPEGCFSFDRSLTNLWAEKNRFTGLLITYGEDTSTHYVPEPGVCPLAPQLCSGFAGPRVKTCNGYCFTQTGYDGLTPPPQWQDFKAPSSLYLAGRPSFWCQELPWPAIGADLDDFSNLAKLPAQRRLEGLPCTIPPP